MTQYNNFHVELSNSQLSKLKSETKRFSCLSLSSNIIGNSNDETNFSYKFWGFVKPLWIIHQII